MMNRRQFAKTTLGWTAMALALGSTGITVGCSYAKALLNTVISAVQAILKVAAPTEGWASQLSAALTALIDAEASWTAGGAVTVVIDALNTIANVCAVIPLTAIYSPLIDVLVAGIDAVLAVLVPAPASTHAKVMAVANPHRGRVPLRKPHVWQSHSEAFKGQWNGVAKQLGLTQATI